MAVYTAFAVARIQAEPTRAGQLGAVLPGEALALAARLDAEAATLRGGALAAREVLEASPDSPLEAAETGLRVASGSASAVIVLDGAETLAVAGDAPPLNWGALTAETDRAPREVWFGTGAAEGQAPALLASATASTPQGRRTIMVVAAPARLTTLLSKAGIGAIVSARGQIISAVGAGGIAQADSLSAAFELTPGELRPGRLTRARSPEGASLQIAAQPTSAGAWIAVVGADADPLEILSAREQLGWVLIPLGVAFLLGLLLFTQSRKVEAAQQAFYDSEQRFRMAVEAARCGIWEWDLTTDEVFLSDVTGGMLGWGGGGVVGGQDVLDRVSPDHRERVRQALSTAAL